MTTPPSDDDAGVIERLDAGEPPASPEEAEVRAPYERLLERIRDLEDAAPSSGWEDRGVARRSAAKRKRRLGIVMGTTAAVGLAAVLLMQLCAPNTSGLEVAVLAAPGSTRRGDPAVGDVLRVQARVDRQHVDLRVYLGTKLIARCPGSERCKGGARVELAWSLVEAGAYAIVLLSSASDVPAPTGRSIDDDLLAARSAGASIEIRRLAVSQ